MASHLCGGIALSTMWACEVGGSYSRSNRTNPEFKVFRPVIRSVPVFVVDGLTLPKLTSKHLHHNDSVLVDGVPVGRIFDEHIALGVKASFGEPWFLGAAL